MQAGVGEGGANSRVRTEDKLLESGVFALYTKAPLVKPSFLRIRDIASAGDRASGGQLIQTIERRCDEAAAGEKWGRKKMEVYVDSSVCI